MVRWYGTAVVRTADAPGPFGRIRDSGGQRSVAAMRSLRSIDGAWRVEIDDVLVDYGPLGGVSVRVLHHGVLVAQPDSVAELRRALPAGVLLQFEDPADCRPERPDADGATAPAGVEQAREATGSG